MSTNYDDMVARSGVAAEAAAKQSPEEAARAERARRRFGTSAEASRYVSTMVVERDARREAEEAVTRQPKVGNWLSQSLSRVALARGMMSNMADVAETIAMPRKPKSVIETARDFFVESMGRENAQGGNYLRDDVQPVLDDLSWRGAGSAALAGVGDVGTAALGAVDAAIAADNAVGTFRAPRAVMDFALSQATQALFGEADTSRTLVRKGVAETSRFADSMAPDAETATGEGIYSGIRSLPMAATALLGGAYVGGAKVAATLMGSLATGMSFNEGVGAGLDEQTALRYGVIDGAIEAGTEFLPFARLLPGAGGSFTRRFLQSMGEDIAGEQVATFGQDLNRFLTIEQPEGKTWDAFVAERPDAAYQTLIASLVGNASLTAASGAMQFASRKLGRQVAQVAPVEANERFFDTLGRLAAANGVLARDPQSFEEFVDEVADGTDASEVFVEAAELQTVLNQSDLTVEQVFEITGMTPEGLALAVERGEDVVIPVGQYAARIAPTPLSEQLLPHLRLAPEQMSRKQAETFLQGATEEFQAEADAALADGLAGQERLASRQRVEEAMLGELNAARRFTPEVNQTYASIVGAFMDVQSAKLGVTSEEFAQRYGLRVQSGEVAQPTYDQPQSGDLIGLPANSRGGFAPARQAAEMYMAARGLEYSPPRVYSPVDRERARRIAAEYEAMQNNPNDPEVRAAYTALVEETLAQYEMVKATGLQIEFVQGEDPYAGNPWGAVDDVRDNNHIWVFSTEDGYGREGISDQQRAENPMLAVVEGETWGGQPVLVNDVFRVVHDYFGHIKTGVGFRAGGEENAWRAHSSMFTPLARRALTSETRGQNSWLNFGPHGEANRDALIGDTVFAEQKIGLMPEWTSEEGVADPDGNAGARGTYNHGPLEITSPLDAFRRESLYPTRATRHADGTVYADAVDYYPDRLAKIAEQIGAKAVVAVPANDNRLDQGVALWHSRPPLNPDGTITIQHWGPSGVTVTDPTRWGESNSLPRSERNAITSGLPRTYFGIASGQPGGYIVEFPSRQQYEARVPADKLYDVTADPDGLKQGDGVTKLEQRIKAAGYLGYWSANDQLGLVATVFEPVAVQPARAQTLFQDAVFFSALERTLEKTATQKASAQQWEATLKKTPGIKAEELEWTGILDFLQMQDGPITRDALLEVVRGAGIRVDEVVLGGKLGSRYSVEPLGEDGWAVRGPEGLVSAHNSESEARGAAEGLQWADQMAAPATQFSSWTTDPQNDTYRELLITLPVGEGRNPNRAPSTHWDTNGVIAHARFMDKVDADGKKVLFIEEVQSDWHQKGRDQGYDTVPSPEKQAEVAALEAEVAALEQQLQDARSAIARNAIALNDVVGPYLRAGYDASVADLRERAADPGSPIRAADVDTLSGIFRTQMLINFFGDGNSEGSRSGYLGTADLSGPIGMASNALGQPVPAEIQVLLDEDAALNINRRNLDDSRELVDRELRIARGAVRAGIPDAPFRTGWPELVMKRMIRWAAEHGYERIAWTTGEQQAARYNLSQAVGSLQFQGRDNTGGLLVQMNALAAGQLAENGLGEQTDDYGGGLMTLVMTEAEAKEAFGNDIAQRLATAEQYDVLEGDDLRVGGEGMKAFYDRNLVNITNKLVKKYGAKVGPVQVVEKTREWDSVEYLEQSVAHKEALLAEIDANPDEYDLEGAASVRQNLEIDRAKLEKARAGNPQPGFDITPELADAARGGFTLFQRDRGPRGQIAFAPDITAAPSVITLLRGADLSTFVHELGHFFFEVTNHMASQAGAPPQVVADRDAMLQYLGVESATEWENRTPDQRREGHERVARSFEAYLFEGRAPSIELQGVFGKLRSWMLQVYRTITRLNVELTDEVRGVFDRMLASEEAIAEAQADAEMRPLFAERPDGMSEADWSEYQTLGTDATEAAAKALEARSLRDMKYTGKAVARELKRLQREIKDQRDAMREEVVAEMSQLPVYRATTLFRTGMIDGTQLEGEVKLNTEVIREVLLLEDSPLPDALRGMTKEGGLHPQQAAELLGYSSAHHLLQDLLFASPFNEAVDAETDTRMRERYGDLNSPEEVEQAAQAAVHNEVRGRHVATELAALQNAPGKKRVLMAAARRIANGTIAKLRIRDIRPSTYETAERKAARAARAAGTQDIDEAARQKRNQLLQFHLAKAAHEARDEVKAARDYLTKFNASKTRANIDPDFLDQIDQLLESVELRQVSNREVDRRKALAKWVEDMQAQGFEPALDPDQMRDLRSTAWRDLTVEEMRGLRDAVRNIEYLGRLTKKLMTAKDQADLDTAANEMAEAVRVNAHSDVDPIIGAKTWWELVRSGVTDFFAFHRKMANMVYVFDGNKYGGVFWERFIRPMNDAGNRETTMTREANLRLAAVFEPLMAHNTTRREYVPEIGKSLSLEDRLMVALNMGNAANLQRLMDGDRWTYEQVQAVIRPLTAEHWNFVENVWREIDSWWPQIAAKQTRVSGIPPEKVEAQPFQVEIDGQLRLIPGGYFPIKYDTDRSSKADADESAEVLRQMTRGLYTNASTRRGHTKERADAVVGRPLRKDFGVIFGHTTQVIHDLAWHEYLIDANRLLKHGAVDSAIRDQYGPEALRWMRKALEDIAVGDLAAQNAFEKSIRHLRTGVSISAMGWSVWTSLLQPTGLTQSMARIGAKHVMKGLGDLFSTPAKMNEKVQWIYSVSPFMRDRGNTMQREINEIRNHIGPKSPLRKAAERVVPANVSGVVTDSFFVMIAKAQLIADLPTWLGQYSKAIDEGRDPDTAVAMADQSVIDSQGSGQIKDLAGVQRGSELMRLFTNFYSYFSATFNLMSDRTQQLRRIGKADLPYYLVDMSLLTVVPATIASLMYIGLRTDEDEPEEILKTVAVDNLAYMMGLMIGVREIGGTLAGAAGYQGPAGARFFAELAKLGKQAGQGEVDEAALRAANSTAGILLHYPAAQMDRTVRGLMANAEGEAGPQAVVFGPPVDR
jgi:hypothetical protein